MPSYQYTRDIKPEDLKPDASPEYSKKEKAKNWWQYHKVWLAVGIAVAVLLGVFIYDMVTQVEPDIKVGVLCPYGLPEDLVAKLEQGIAAYTGDLNGDGQVSVQVEVYTIGASQQSALPQGVEVAPADTANENDPYLEMAGMARLVGAFEDGDPVLFLLHPGMAQAYQAEYELLGPPDGTVAGPEAPVEDLALRFADIAAFAGMELQFAYGIEEIELDGHSILDDYLVGVRAIYGTRLEEQKGGLQRWQDAWALMGRLEAGIPVEAGEGTEGT